ncbi:hypothetical protein THOM_1301 [Trachipleistophora hominis]|uniref:Uncharacterized protein n=1 Tax=Trachipleistophora hominis TaxID=72359 RepID=L7JWA3_TRAHO|nr:hypothetical protein THOM_1301 [Trachipleistophora hominis]
MNSCCITLSRGVRPLLGMCIRSNDEYHVYEYYDSWLFAITKRVLACYNVDKIYIAEEQEMLCRAIEKYVIVKIARKYFEMECHGSLYGMLAHSILCNYSAVQGVSSDTLEKNVVKRAHDD